VDKEGLTKYFGEDWVGVISEYNLNEMDLGFFISKFTFNINQYKQTA
jgi:hypothetical protein